jgi:hypothetical protein
MTSQFNTSDLIISDSSITGLTVNQQINGISQTARDSITVGLNGVSIPVTNGFLGSAHSYTVNTGGLVHGDRLSYVVNLSTTNSNTSVIDATYECSFVTSAGTFSFGVESIPTTSLNTANTIGVVRANFRGITDGLSDQLLCDYSILLYDPNSPNVPTYENYSFQTISFAFASSSFNVYSSIGAPSPFLKVTLLGSEFSGLI